MSKLVEVKGTYERPGPAGTEATGSYSVACAEHGPLNGGAKLPLGGAARLARLHLLEHLERVADELKEWSR